MIVNDARVSRLICHVAEQFEMSCSSINNTDDASAACKKSRPDVIFLDPEPCETSGKDKLKELAKQHTDAAIVLTCSGCEHTGQLKDMCESLDLNMAGVLPDVFDADILKQEFISIFHLVGKQLADKPFSGADVVGPMPDR